MSEQNATVAEMNAIVDEIVEIKEEKASIAERERSLNERFRELEAALLAHMDANELDSFKGTRATISKVDYFSVKVPNTLEKKRELFQYLKQLKIHDELVTVNSQTLNSFYKEQMESAKERGEFDFKIPGVEEPTHQPKIRVTGKK